jgi:uncharacterized alpha-E superfamily protein
MAARSESLEWLLEVGDSLNVYRQGYALPPHLAPVLALLLGDELHPGSLAFQSRQISGHLAPLLPERAEPEWQVAPSPASSTDLVELRARLREWTASIASLSNRLSLRFFVHVDEDSRSLYV